MYSESQNRLLLSLNAALTVCVLNKFNFLIFSTCQRCPANRVFKMQRKTERSGTKNYQVSVHEEAWTVESVARKIRSRKYVRRKIQGLSWRKAQPSVIIIRYLNCTYASSMGTDLINQNRVEIVNACPLHSISEIIIYLEYITWLTLLL
jgi:hypothetical protein